MCVGLAARVVNVKDGTAVIDAGGAKRDVSAELLEDLDAEAAFDTESYDNGTGIIPSYLLVPWTVTVDNLDDLAETGLYQWDEDNKYLESTAKN